MPIGATIGAAVAGAGASVIGSSMQAGATKDASRVQQAQQAQTRADLMPFIKAGYTGTNMLMSRLPELTKDITMDQAALQKTPGYQFALRQGLKSTQNSAAARGLGTSGAALKGAASYATGLADNTYQNQFNNAVTNQTNAYNRLIGVAQLGQTSAAQVGDLGNKTASSIGQNTIAGGNAAAAGIVGAGNALTNGANQYAGIQWAKQNPGMYGNPYARVA